MKMKKILALLLILIVIFSAVTVTANAKKALVIPDCFEKGIGPETDGFSIDYRYFSPLKENDSTKYPLVIWLHGMGDGEYEGKQVAASDIVSWTTDDFQSRFKDSSGAFIFAPRSVEEQKLYWTDELVYPLGAAIDDFIAKNRDNIDVSRIYIGGYSMGGKMTLKMLVAYPEMFAAAFPICPAWVPCEEATARFKDVPVWMTSGAQDPLVNYYAFAMTTWNRIVSQSNVAEICRLSTLKTTCYPNGKRAYSAHLAWFSVNNDMFSSDNGDYPKMKTINGNGDTVTLQYPNGMISWLSQFESNYDGSPAKDKGNDEAYTGFDMNVFTFIITWVKNYFASLKDLFR